MKQSAGAESRTGRQQARTRVCCTGRASCAGRVSTGIAQRQWATLKVRTAVAGSAGGEWPPTTAAAMPAARQSPGRTPQPRSPGRAAHGQPPCQLYQAGPLLHCHQKGQKGLPGPRSRWHGPRHCCRRCSFHRSLVSPPDCPQVARGWAARQQQRLCREARPPWPPVGRAPPPPPGPVAPAAQPRQVQLLLHFRSSGHALQEAEARPELGLLAPPRLHQQKQQQPPERPCRAALQLPRLRRAPPAPAAPGFRRPRAWAGCQTAGTSCCPGPSRRCAARWQNPGPAPSSACLQGPREPWRVGLG